MLVIGMEGREETRKETKKEARKETRKGDKGNKEVRKGN
jgi:hypothetical protein